MLVRCSSGIPIVALTLAAVSAAAFRGEWKDLSGFSWNRPAFAQPPARLKVADFIPLCYGNSFPTKALIDLPSADPAALVCTALITGPISFFDVAPSS